ncbi:ExbD/TolR family protein [Tenacibaculum jejuense]|uniref:Lipoprotein n=1 Tax=Tenacibaculum jejuense TaxID=584609 RepID=A0A238U6Z3_9FLAO|nr:biopolymer transporter ExbD [Tenacibaculum jejuense]SNR14150.1 protein of unknown function [Tenacibaculum jejuense]
MKQTTLIFIALAFFIISCQPQVDNRGIPKKITKSEKGNKKHDTINAFKININSKSEILIENQKIDIKQLRKKIKDYETINESKSLIIISSHKAVDYGTYVILQNAIIEEINNLRKSLAQKKFNTDIENLNKEQLNTIKLIYPIEITDGS